jgi:hypothetical protein
VAAYQFPSEGRDSGPTTATARGNDDDGYAKRRVPEDCLWAELSRMPFAAGCRL